jgi:uncharacterized membrane protein
MQTLYLLAATALAALLVDIPYLWMRLDFHRTFFMSVQQSPLNMRIIPAVFVYVLFAVALVFVALKPAASLKDAAVRGALVGAVMYGFYDATNLATLTGWTWNMAIVDTLWGATAGALVASIMYKVESS